MGPSSMTSPKQHLTSPSTSNTSNFLPLVSSLSPLEPPWSHQTVMNGAKGASGLCPGEGEQPNGHQQMCHGGEGLRLLGNTERHWTGAQWRHQAARAPGLCRLPLRPPSPSRQHPPPFNSGDAPSGPAQGHHPRLSLQPEGKGWGVILMSRWLKHHRVGGLGSPGPGTLRVPPWPEGSPARLSLLPHTDLFPGGSTRVKTGGLGPVVQVQIPIVLLTCYISLDKIPVCSPAVQLSGTSPSLLGRKNEMHRIPQSRT